MEKILVATDFSQQAAAAVNSAVFLTDLLDAQLDILHAYQMISPPGMYSKVSGQLSGEKREAMAKLIRKLEKPDLRIAPLLSNHTPDEAILERADDYDLIVMGSKGEWDLENFFLGSTTQRVVRRLRTPLLAIPPEAPVKKLQQIVMAVDQRQITRDDLLSPLRKLIRAADAQLKLYQLQEHDDEEFEFSEALRRQLKGIDYSTHVEFKNTALKEALQHFVEEETGDVYVLIHHHRSNWLQFLQPDTIRRELQNLQLPLLLLSDR